MWWKALATLVMVAGPAVAAAVIEDAKAKQAMGQAEYTAGDIEALTVTNPEVGALVARDPGFFERIRAFFDRDGNGSLSGGDLVTLYANPVESSKGFWGGVIGGGEITPHQPPAATVASSSVDGVATMIEDIEQCARALGMAPRRLAEALPFLKRVSMIPDGDLARLYELL